MPLTYLLPLPLHHNLVTAAYLHRGFNAEEAKAAADFSELTSTHGIKTHNAIKAIHLDELFGSKAGGCTPNANIQVIPQKFKAVEKWNANKKLGQATAFAAMDRAMQLADEFGTGTVAVDNAFHYLWGGGYVINAAKKGYIAYTACTAALAEVVPFGGKFPTLGTNPHSWGFPTTEQVGFPICIDWATSIVAMGRIQQFARENTPVPEGWGVDAAGNPTTDPNQIKALFPFGQHKGYGLSLIDELLAAYIGGSLPTLRNRWSQIPQPVVPTPPSAIPHRANSDADEGVGTTSKTSNANAGEKGTCCFYFQVTHPESIGVSFAQNRTQSQNVKAVLEDILGHGNSTALLPGQLEAQAAALTKKHNALLFTKAEIDALAEIAKEANFPFDTTSLKTVEA